MSAPPPKAVGPGGHNIVASGGPPPVALHAPHAHHAHHAKKTPAAKRAKPAHVKKAHKKVKRGFAGPGAGPWLLAGNDVLDTCAVAAVANSLLLATGIRPADAELAHLPAATSIEELLECVAGRGLAGVRLARYGPVEDWLDGVVAGVRLPGGAPHTVTAAGRLVVSWGALGPLEGDVEEAWLPEWEAVG